jgi:hypothetical protein
LGDRREYLIPLKLHLDNATGVKGNFGTSAAMAADAIWSCWWEAPDYEASRNLSATTTFKLKKEVCPETLPGFEGAFETKRLLNGQLLVRSYFNADGLNDDCYLRSANRLISSILGKEQHWERHEVFDAVDSECLRGGCHRRQQPGDYLRAGGAFGFVA